MRVIKYYLHLVVEEMIKDTEFNCQIISSAKLSKHNSANLSQLLMENLAYKDYFNDKLMEISLNRRIKDYQFYSYEDIEKEFSYNGYQYIPSIYIPNLRNVDQSKTPITSFGTEADSETFPELEDFIVAFLHNEDLTTQEIYLDEKTVLELSTPVFIVDNGIDYEKYEKNAKNSLKPLSFNSRLFKGLTTSYYLNLKSYDHRINVRYESVGNSEFCITGALIDTECDPDSIRLYLPEVSTWLEINSIAKDEIGTFLYKWVTIAYWWDIEPWDQHYLFFNTFERDWLAGSKPLGSATVGSTTLYLFGNMTYSTDYYAYNPDGGLYEDIDLQYIYDNSSRWYANYLYWIRFYLD